MLPWVTDRGLIVVIDGMAGVTVNPTVFEVAPPGFTTVTFRVPGVATRLAGTVASNSPALTNEVMTDVWFRYKADPETKLAPATVSVNAEPVAISEPGDKLRIDGAVTVNATAPEVDAPGFIT